MPLTARHMLSSRGYICLAAHTAVGSSRMRPFWTPPAGRQDTPAGFHGVKYASCSGRIAPERLRHALLEAWLPPQVRDNTDTPPIWVCVDRNATTGHAYEKSASKSARVAIPWPPRVSHRCPVPNAGSSSFNFLFHPCDCAEISGPRRRNLLVSAIHIGEDGATRPASARQGNSRGAMDNPWWP
jgi:hypothetical protein